MSELFGYAGKILRVDLSTGGISTESLDEATCRKYLGGTGLGAKVLYDEVPPGVEWNAPANRFIMGSGPLGATRIGGSGTFSVVTKGAMTGGATSTQANGFFGAFLRLSGFDAVVIQGAAPKWAYVYIHDGAAEIRDASKLLGKTTWETEDAIKAELGKQGHEMSVFGIGPAGENQVRFACLVGDRGHVAAHNGPGAVLGSKRLKAVAVARGQNRIPLKDGEALSAIAKNLIEGIKASPGMLDVYNWGTLQGVLGGNKAGWLPVKNYTTSAFPGDAEALNKFSAESIRTNFSPKPHPCWACQMHHAHIMTVPDGPYAGKTIEEPEYEGLSAWGPVIGNADVSSAAFLANEVDRLGMDTNESGWLIGFVMECYEKGLITKKDTEGLELKWGNAEAALQMLHKVANRQGLGNILAEGLMRGSQKLGGEAAKLAIYTQKGNTPRGHDHRANWSEMFDTCTSSTGTIEATSFVSRKLFDLPPMTDIFSPEQIVLKISKTKGTMPFEDSLGVCMFNTRTDMPVLVEAVKAATGWDFTFQEAMGVGRRAVNLLRAFNMRHGLTAEEDAPSTRYSSTPVDGMAKGKSIAEVFPQMRAKYYEAMGWDKETGRPLPQTLKDLGLENVAKDLWG
ncbi:MAG: hypothetical protein HY671_13875 [Chloroflexi bacterium]|nr:hypothetical protein [Chloroflexota bacterium]